MKLGYRALLVVALLIASSVYLLPVVTTVPSWWPSFFPRESLRLGLDLQGGIHLILQVEGDGTFTETVALLRGRRGA